MYINIPCLKCLGKGNTRVFPINNLMLEGIHVHLSPVVPLLTGRVHFCDLELVYV